MTLCGAKRCTVIPTSGARRDPGVNAGFDRGIPRCARDDGTGYSSFFASSQYLSNSAIPTSPTSLPLSRERRATSAKRRRKRALALRSADSGSILRRRARLTTERRRSPISCSSAAWSSAVARRPPLRELLLDLVDDVGVPLPVEAEVAGTQGLAVGHRERRERGRKGAQRILGRSGLPPLAPLPRVLDLLGAPGGGGAAEDVGMAVDHLLGDLAGDVADAEPSLLGRQAREEENLEEEVSELVAQRVGGALVQGREHLVGLLEQVGTQRLEGLLAVPGALAAEPLDERVEPIEGLGHAREAISFRLTAFSRDR